MVALHVSFVNQCVTWLRAECTHCFDLRVFITSCLCRFAICFVEMLDVKEQRVVLRVVLRTWQQCGIDETLKQGFGDDAVRRTETYD